METENSPVIIICPHCNNTRKKMNGHYNIKRRGYERNGMPRYFCINCERWFNETTSKNMHWYSR